MHFSTAVTAVAAIVPFVNAHDGPSIPSVAGLNIRDLKVRNVFANIRARAAELEHSEVHEKRTNLQSRQGGNANGQCGTGLPSCAAGYCCSSEGWCGKGNDYCYSPGCQYKFGPACPENMTPAGANTSTVARTKLGSVTYGGAGIYNCVTPGTVAITYDDGPLSNYTAHILDIFASYKAKATFFITGNNINKGEIDTTPELTAVIKRMYGAGHQIASHTYTHLDLSAVSAVDRKNQMWKNEMALRNILGFFPTYMRPPFSSCTAASGCEKDMADLGYHVVYFDVDTDDYNQAAPNKIQTAKNNFKNGISAGGATSTNSEWLSIAHDIHEQTAYNLTDFMLSTLTGLGYRAVTVGECLGDPVANWYRSSAGGGTGSTTTPAVSVSRTSSAPAATGTKKVTTDATCGGTNGFTCQGSTFGNCCSPAGWCGSTSAYCGTGCQPAFGTCGTTAASSSVRPASSSVRPASSSVRPASSSVRPASSSVRPASSSTRASSAAPPASTLKASADGTCAGTTGFTCTGSTFGTCCSQYGWCGTTTGHCGTGCQKAFGTCT